MLMEEWCKANDENIIEFVNDLQEVVGQVQDEFGKLNTYPARQG